MNAFTKITAIALIAIGAVAAAPAVAPSFSGAIANAITSGQIGMAVFGMSPSEFTRMSVRQQAVAQGPGGCATFNQAVADAVATQIRRGDMPEARRLSAMAVPCAAR